MKAFFFFLITTTLLFSQKSIVISDNFESRSLDDIIEYYEDTTGNLSILDIDSLSNDKFQFLGKYLNLGFSRSSFWVRFKIKNNRKSNKFPLWVVRANNTEIDYIDYYQISEDNIIIKSSNTGNMFPVKSRQRLDENFMFFTSVPQNKLHTIYLRIKTDTPIKLSFSMFSLDQYLIINNHMTLFIGLFIGMLLLAIGYYSTLYFRTKDRSFLYLALAGLALLLSFLTSSGFAYLYIWPDYTYWNKLSVPITDALLIIFFIKFISVFLELKKYLPMWYRVLQINFYLLIVLAGLVPFTNIFIIKQSIYIGMMIALVLTIPVSFLTLRKGYKPAKFFFIGILFLTPASLYYLTIEFGILPLSTIGEKGYLVASIFLIWFFSQAVSERIKLLRFEKDDAENELHKSEERLSLIIKATDLGTWDWNIQNNVITRNERWSEILGFSPEEMKNNFEYWKSLIHEDDKGQTLENLNVHLRGDSSSYETEYRIRHKSGNWIWVLDRGKSIEYDKNGKPIRVAGTITDITKRKRAEITKQVIFNIANAVSTTKNMHAFYKTIHHELNKIIEAKNFQVGIYDKKRDVIQLPYLVDQEDDNSEFPLGKRRSAYVLKKKKVILFRQKDEKKLVDKGELEIIGTPTKAWLGAPLMLNNDVLV